MSDEQTPETTKPTRTQPPILIEYREGPTEPWGEAEIVVHERSSHAAILAEIRSRVESGGASRGDYRLVREYRRVRFSKVEKVSIEMDDLEGGAVDGGVDVA